VSLISSKAMAIPAPCIIMLSQDPVHVLSSIEMFKSGTLIIPKQTKKLAHRKKSQASFFYAFGHSTLTDSLICHTDPSAHDSQEVSGIFPSCQLPNANHDMQRYQGLVRDTCKKLSTCAHGAIYPFRSD
jgi:hypothetical protein